MKTEIHKHLKFTIGEQYENYEFQLSSIKEYVENGISYEVYLYTSSEKSIFNQEADKILLHFNADILMKVECIFNVDCFDELKEQINKLITPINEDTYFVSWYFENIELILELNTQENITKLLYQKI